MSEKWQLHKDDKPLSAPMDLRIDCLSHALAKGWVREVSHRETELFDRHGHSFTYEVIFKPGYSIRKVTSDE